MSPDDLLGMPLTGYIALWVFAFGAAVGSFLNVVAHRLPQRRSIVAPRSRCPRCRLPIRPWHNVPVLGWLLLRGRCRDCGGTIPWRYPAVELATGLLFAACWWRFGVSPAVLAAWLWTALFVVLALVDLDARILPFELTVPAAGIALWVPGLSWVAPRQAVAGLLLGAGLGLVASAAWRLARGVDGLASGDVGLLALLGAVFGVDGLLVVLAGACAVGTCVAGTMAAAQRLARRRAASPAAEGLPFGTFLGVVSLALLVADPRVAVLWLR